MNEDILNEREMVILVDIDFQNGELPTSVSNSLSFVIAAVSPTASLELRRWKKTNNLHSLVLLTPTMREM